MLTNKKALASIALVMVVLLVTFGIDRIGGETWVTAAAKAEAGWYAEVRPYSTPPVPFLRGFFIPLLLIATAGVVAVIGAILNYFSRTREEEVPTFPEEPSPGAPIRGGDDEPLQQ